MPAAKRKRRSRKDAPSEDSKLAEEEQIQNLPPAKKRRTKLSKSPALMTLQMPPTATHTSAEADNTLDIAPIRPELTDVGFDLTPPKLLPATQSTTFGEFVDSDVSPLKKSVAVGIGTGVQPLSGMTMTTTATVIPRIRTMSLSPRVTDTMLSPFSSPPFGSPRMRPPMAAALSPSKRRVTFSVNTSPMKMTIKTKAKDSKKSRTLLPPQHYAIFASEKMSEKSRRKQKRRGTEMTIGSSRVQLRQPRSPRRRQTFIEESKQSPATRVSLSPVRARKRTQALGIGAVVDTRRPVELRTTSRRSSPRLSSPKLSMSKLSLTKRSSPKLSTSKRSTTTKTKDTGSGNGTAVDYLWFVGSVLWTLLRSLLLTVFIVALVFALPFVFEALKSRFSAQSESHSAAKLNAALQTVVSEKPESICGLLQRQMEEMKQSSDLGIGSTPVTGLTVDGHLQQKWYYDALCVVKPSPTCPKPKPVGNDKHALFQCRRDANLCAAELQSYKVRFDEATNLLERCSRQKERQSEELRTYLQQYENAIDT